MTHPPLLFGWEERARFARGAGSLLDSLKRWGKGRSRFPEGMTERKATGTAMAKSAARAKARANTGVSPLRFAPVEMTEFGWALRSRGRSLGGRFGRDDGVWVGASVEMTGLVGWVGLGFDQAVAALPLLLEAGPDGVDFWAGHGGVFLLCEVGCFVAG